MLLIFKKTEIKFLIKGKFIKENKKDKMTIIINNRNNNNNKFKTTIIFKIQNHKEKNT